MRRKETKVSFLTWAALMFLHWFCSFNESNSPVINAQNVFESKSWSSGCTEHCYPKCVLNLAAWASQGSLLDPQPPYLLYQNLNFNKIPRWCVCTLKCKLLWLKAALFYFLSVTDWYTFQYISNENRWLKRIFLKIKQRREFPLWHSRNESK